MWLPTYLGRSPKFLQLWEPSGHILEGLMDGIVIHPSQDTPGVTVREHHSLAYTCDLLNGAH